MKNKDILLADGYIDLYVNKDKYNSYKTNRGKFSYVYRVLSAVFDSVRGNVVNEVTIRDIYITSNHFWGIDSFCVINDIGYCGSKKLPLNEDKLTLRIFNIDLIGVVIIPVINKRNLFLSVSGEGYYIKMGTFRLI